MRNKLCIITGATSGIGRATALELGALGANLILLGRNESVGKNIAAQISRSPQAGTVLFLRCDLSSQQEVRHTAESIISRHSPVDLLINNAGARNDTFQRSAEGHELTFATNHLGHFLLTHLLLKQILTAANGKIITVASGAHGSAKADGKWMLDAAGYDRKMAYANSKLANLLFAYELARHLAGTPAISFAVDPGGVASNFSRNNGLVSWGKHLVSHVLQRNLISPHEAALSIIPLAQAGSPAPANGSYYYRRQLIQSSPASHNSHLARSLWTLSLALTGLENGAEMAPPLR